MAEAAHLRYRTSRSCRLKASVVIVRDTAYAKVTDRLRMLWVCEIFQGRMRSHFLHLDLLFLSTRVINQKTISLVIEHVTLTDKKT